MGDASVRHRIFARCNVCHRDIARWEDGGGWWHLDGNIPHGHIAIPGDLVTGISQVEQPPDPPPTLGNFG